MAVDTIFNEQMRPVFVDEPREVMRRLKAQHPESWSKVCVGESGNVVTIAEYLYGDKRSEVIALLNDLLRKQDLAMYRRNPDRLRVYVEAHARKIIECVLELKEKP